MSGVQLLHQVGQTVNILMKPTGSLPRAIARAEPLGRVAS